MRNKFKKLIKNFIDPPINPTKGREDMTAQNQADLIKEWNDFEKNQPEEARRYMGNWNRFDQLLNTKIEKQGLRNKKSRDFAEAEEESGNKVLYKNPCLSLMSSEVNDFVDGLDPQAQATPGNYNIVDRNEPTKVALYVKKCPSGTIQNIRKGICELRPGFDLKLLCDRPNSISGKSEIEMLTSHITQLQNSNQKQQFSERASEISFNGKKHLENDWDNPEMHEFNCSCGNKMQIPKGMHNLGVTTDCGHCGRDFPQQQHEKAIKESYQDLIRGEKFVNLD